MSYLPDPLDRATELTAQTTESSIARVRAAARPEQEQKPDGTWPHTECADDCGERIPLGRLALGKIRCIRCQAKRDGSQWHAT